MFFVPDILVRKGPLSIVWLAAHYEKKLSKSTVMSLNICNLIGLISSTNIKISLRITCDLMIGLSKLIQIKSKFIFNESDHRNIAIHRMAGQFANRNKLKRKVIDLPDNQFSIDKLNLPEINEFLDLNLPDPATIFPESPLINDDRARRASITMQEVLPLTKHGLIDEEFDDRLYGDVGSVDFNEFFDEVLPSPHPQEPLLSSDHLPPPPQVEPMEFTDQQVPMSNKDTLTGIITPPLLELDQSIADIPDQKGIKRMQKDPNYSSTIEKRRRTSSISSGRETNLGSLELTALDDSSRLLNQPRRRPIRNKKIKIDYRTQIADNVLRQNMIEAKNWCNTMPNIFIPDKKLYDTCANLFNSTERQLNKNLEFYFRNARLNTLIDNDMITTQIALSHGSGEDMTEMNGDFFQEALPAPAIDDELPPQQLSPFFDDNIPPTDIDGGEIPLVRGNDERVFDSIGQPSNIPDFSNTDRTIIDEKFNQTLDDLLFTSKNDTLEFNQLNFHDNHKRTVILYFYNLLLMKNNEQIDLEQESSIQEFNPIYIHRVYQSQAI